MEYIYSKKKKFFFRKTKTKNKFDFFFTQKFSQVRTLPWILNWTNSLIRILGINWLIHWLIDWFYQTCIFDEQLSRARVRKWKTCECPLNYMWHHTCVNLTLVLALALCLSHVAQRICKFQCLANEQNVFFFCFAIIVVFWWAIACFVFKTI